MLMRRLRCWLVQEAQMVQEVQLEQMEQEKEEGAAQEAHSQSSLRAERGALLPEALRLLLLLHLRLLLRLLLAQRLLLLLLERLLQSASSPLQSRTQRMALAASWMRMQCHPQLWTPLTALHALSVA